jgi:hypothetical protein
MYRKFDVTGNLFLHSSFFFFEELNTPYELLPVLKQQLQIYRTHRGRLEGRNEREWERGHRWMEQ